MCTFAPAFERPLWFYRESIHRKKYYINYLNNSIMLIIPVKEGEAIDRALKRFKRKFDRTGAMKQLRSRKQFNKPSVVNRKQKSKAIYVQGLRTAEES